MQRVIAVTTVLARQPIPVGEKRVFIRDALLKRHIATAFDANQCGNVVNDHMEVV